MFSKRLINRKPIVNVIKLSCSSVHSLNTKHSNVRSPEAVFLEKTAEVPIISVTEKENVDMIGPPDPISNLRPIIRKRSLHETILQQKLREIQDSTQEWNQKFWSEHNTKFVKERQVYIKAHRVSQEENRALTADEMSEFYKKFLDENWKTHVTYNFQWYKKNFEILILAFRVYLETLLRHS
ncbi:COA8 family protein CG14806, mitochondrial [Onthophagus taurus]|uniref:COA8 family protein CG14806, mitochondrial n=1 Tax=Onthophagus taurus TaxID=166361 RepID=UPI000C209062|nr:APOPT family protein CG14806, mitochondrial [Onthophagus taurus]